MSKKQKLKKHQDPQAEQERGKYESPIFSREYIQQFLTDHKKSATYAQLLKEFEYDSEQQKEALKRRLLAMVRDGQLTVSAKGAYKIIDESNFMTGKVVGHKDGFGFFVPDAGGDDLFLSIREMRSVFPGDRVQVSLAGVDQRGKKQAKIVKVLESKTQQLVGRFYKDRDRVTVVPEDPRFSRDIEVTIDPKKLPAHGQVVVVAITRQPSKYLGPCGKIVEILGDYMAPGMETDIAIRQHGIPNEWSEAVKDELKKFPDSVSEEEIEGRVDLRRVPLVTIDGKDAKDFDDAVYCEKLPDGRWKLLVAIADVSHYVREGTALDEEALLRGNSVYFPRRVIPMLPYQLSNVLCSLNPKVDRLAMVSEMIISREGDVLPGAKFYEAVIYSHARMTYNDVAAIVVDKKQDMRLRYKELLPQFDELYNLYKVLHVRRQKRGAMDFDFPETQLLFDKQLKIKAIEPLHRNDAHRLIEECMLCANVSAANFLLEHKSPALYRVHLGPVSEKLVKLRSYLGRLGLVLGGGDDPTPKDFAKLIDKIKDRVDANIIRLMVLRSLKQAVYTPDNQGHFGLAYDAYGHFTSPIRRYPDLLVHRAIRAVIRKQKSLFDMSEKQMADYGEHCSMTERRADVAVYDAIGWLKCEFMLERVGKNFSGSISSVTSFGIFVQLDDFFVEGLVHITNLPKDYYVFDDVGHCLVGERAKKSFSIGDKVRICVARVDLEERQIDFELIEKSK